MPTYLALFREDLGLKWFQDSIANLRWFSGCRCHFRCSEAPCLWFGQFFLVSPLLVLLTFWLFNCDFSLFPLNLFKSFPAIESDSCFCSMAISWRQAFWFLPTPSWHCVQVASLANFALCCTPGLIAGSWPTLGHYLACPPRLPFVAFSARLVCQPTPSYHLCLVCYLWVKPGI